MSLLGWLNGNRCDHGWELEREVEMDTMTFFQGSRGDLLGAAAREQAMPGAFAPAAAGEAFVPGGGRQMYFYTMIERTWKCAGCGAIRHTEEGPLDITTAGDMGGQP